MLLAAALAASAPTADWQTYVNARFGFEICYPASVLIPQSEADNGDGQTFTSDDGAQLKAFGTHNALGRSLAQEAGEQARHYAGAKGRITYRAAKPGWQAISGRDGRSNLFYTKTIAREDGFLMFQLRYPAKSAARYKPVVERLTRCFRPL